MPQYDFVNTPFSFLHRHALSVTNKTPASPTKDLHNNQIFSFVFLASVTNSIWKSCVRQRQGTKSSFIHLDGLYILLKFSRIWKEAVMTWRGTIPAFIRRHSGTLCKISSRQLTNIPNGIHTNTNPQYYRYISLITGRVIILRYKFVVVCELSDLSWYQFMAIFRTGLHRRQEYNNRGTVTRH